MQVPKKYWYPILESTELKTKPLRIERLGVHLVCWRTSDGEPHASTDRCPHLGAALSGGKVSQDRLICPFHGFEYSRNGQCQHIPAIGRKGKIPKGMRLEKFVLQERLGFIWLWWGEV